MRKPVPHYTVNTLEWDFDCDDKHEAMLVAKSEPVGVPVAVIKWVPHVIWQRTEGDDE